MKWSQNGLVVALAMVAVVATGQQQNQEQPPKEKRWRVSAGWVHQWGRGMDVEGPAPSLYNRLHLQRGSKWEGQPPPNGMTGPENGLPAQWNYDDGYVFPDEQSDIAHPGDDPNASYSTHYWHYENPDQYSVANPARPTLTFHRDLGLHYSGDPSVTTDAHSDDDLPRDGVEIRLSRWLHTWKDQDMDLDVVVGVAWFPDTDPVLHSRTTRQNLVHRVTRYTYVDYFGSTGGGAWQPGLDNWYPYYGRFHTNDDPPGDNPIIPLDYAVDPASKVSVINDTVGIEATFWRLRGVLGPSVTKPLTRRLSAYVAPQFALEYVDVCVDRTETVTVDRRGRVDRRGGTSDHEDATEFVPGFLLTAGANYAVTTNWLVGASVGWEWLSRDVDVNIGPDKVSFDLDGAEVSITLSRKF